MFSFYLTHTDDLETLGKSHVDIGFIDYDKIEGDIVWVPSNKKSFFWLNYVDGLSFVHPEN